MKRLIFLILLGISVNNSWGQSDLETIKATVFKEVIKGHINYLASDELRGRETGTPGIEKAAEYIAQQFRSYGVQPLPEATGRYFQEVLLKGKAPAQHTAVTVGDKEFKGKGQLALMQGGNMQKKTVVLFLDYGLEEDYEGQDVKGKIILVKAGSPDQRDPASLFKLGMKKRRLAHDLGADMLIEFHPFDDKYWKSVSGYVNHKKTSLANEEERSIDGFPHLWINDKNNQLADIASTDKLQINVMVKGMSSGMISSRNVVGMVEGTDPKLKDEYVIYSAHYDHVGVGKPNAEGDSIYNGARDNAVGVVTVLSAAEHIAKYPTKRSALFILFTAEEMGLLGSKWYVEHPLIPLKQSVFCFNSDNASYNDTTVATIVGLERTTAADKIKEACQAFGLKAIDDPAPEQNLFDRSDNVHFATKGIPAPTFSLGFTAFDDELFKYYHQVTDNPETLDYDYLEKFFRAYVMSCRNIANGTETPVWIEGDKYYKAGQRLYEK